MSGNGSRRMVKQIKAISWTRWSSHIAGQHHLLVDENVTDEWPHLQLELKRCFYWWGNLTGSLLLFVTTQWATTTLLTLPDHRLLRVALSVQSVEASLQFELKMRSPVGDVFIDEEIMLSSISWWSSCSDIGSGWFYHSPWTIPAHSKTILFSELF